MKKLEDYIHLYIGCDVMLNGKILQLAGVCDAVGGYTKRAQLLRRDTEWSYKWADYDEIKLILRPLSSMTEEEAKELIQFEKLNREYANVDFKIINGYKGGIVAIEVNYTIVDEDIVMPKVWTFNFCAMNSDDFRHLLSKGFDLFGLIDSGLALDSTKIEKV